MAKKFTNNEIKLSEIPNFEHIITKKLEKSYLNIVVINEIIIIAAASTTNLG